MRVMVIVDGADPTRLTVAEASARLGHDTSVADLRRARFELRTGSTSGVRLDGEPLDVEVVVNRTGVNGLGLAPPAALRRQVGRTWYQLHSAAREEQGLLLAVFDRFALSGVRVINPPVAAELELMRNLVIERMARLGVAMFPAATPDVGYLVVGGRVALQPGQERPDPDVLRTCNVIAEAARFDLGEVSFDSSHGAARLVGWTAMPELTHLDLPMAEALADSLMVELFGRSDGEVVLPSRPFISDMVERFEQS